MVHLLIDGTDYSSKAQKSISGSGKIAFEATDTDILQNAVAVDGDVVGVFNEGTYNVATYVYDINADKFDAGKQLLWNSMREIKQTY
ncbi:MAG: hypothetical protein ACLTCI_06760 [[Clostridium] nexile]